MVSFIYENAVEKLTNIIEEEDRRIVECNMAHPVNRQTQTKECPCFNVTQVRNDADSEKLQSSQKTLNDRRVNALRVALGLIKKEMRSNNAN